MTIFVEWLSAQKKKDKTNYRLSAHHLVSNLVRKEAILNT